MGSGINYITGIIIAGTITTGTIIIASKIESLENTLRETLKERSTFTGTPEEKEIDGKLYMCVPREGYGR